MLGWSVKSLSARRANGGMTVTFAEIMTPVVALAQKATEECRMCLVTENLRLLSGAHLTSS